MLHEMSDALPACPVETTLTLISDKWKVLILRDLLTGTKRFGELKKSLDGVSQKVLTSQLGQMEANGLLTRKVFMLRCRRVLNIRLLSLVTVCSLFWRPCVTGARCIRRDFDLRNKQKHHLQTQVVFYNIWGIRRKLFTDGLHGR